VTLDDKLPIGKLRLVREQDLPLVLAWRNHPEVRRYMFSTHIITFEEHRRWFERTSQDSARHLLLFEQDNVPLGFINLRVFDSAAGLADWGFYVSREAPRGTGLLLGKTVVRHSFEVLGLHKLCGQVLDFNERSLRFHLRLGFQKEGILREHHFDGTRYHDLVCFGFLKNEWVKHYEK